MMNYEVHSTHRHTSSARAIFLFYFPPNVQRVYNRWGRKLKW